MTDQATQTFKREYGPWAVVTGASEGIGRAFARELARHGLNLVLVARRAAVLEDLAEDLRASHGIACETIALDLAQQGTAERLLAATAQKQVGLLVAAAGFGTSGPFIAADIDTELQMIDVNCRAVAALAHGYGRRFAAQRRGGLVLLSSLLAFQGVARAANYAATKAFIQVLAEGLRRELAQHNVEVLAVAPGPIASGFAERAGMAMSLAGRPADVARGALRALGRRTTVRPGFLSWFLEAALWPLPRFGRVRIMQQVMASMTRQRPA